MNKPQGYDEAQSYTGDFEQLELGGHICQIVGVKLEYTPNTNAEVLILALDIAEGEQKGYYQKLFDEAKKKDNNAKWKCTYRQFTQGNSTPYFKGMIENIEKSNEGYNFAGTGFNEQTLVGKFVGGVFGREQYEAQDGKLKFATKCVQLRTTEAIRNGVEVPVDKLLQKQDDYFSTDSVTNSDSDLPF